MKCLFLFCAVLSQCCSATISIIFRTNRAEDIIKTACQYPSASTWCIFDCNGVLLRLSDLGLVKAIHEINSLPFSVASSIWSEEPVFLVDENMPMIVRLLQQSDYRCLLLTQRSSDTSSKTPMERIMKQNLGSHYDFSKSWPDIPNEMVLESPPRAGKENIDKAKYKDGVIFSSRSSKGESLRYFMRECEKMGINIPKCIIFADDKIEKIYDVQRVAVELGIMFVGIHYCKLHEMLEHVKPDRSKLMRLQRKNASI